MRNVDFYTVCIWWTD